MRRDKPGLFFQPKLTVNTPGDRYEQEADQVADQVMRIQTGDTPIVQRVMFSPVSAVQRACADCEQEAKEQLQRKETAGDAAGHSVPSLVSDVLASGGGRPMDEGAMQFMGSRFGEDFSQVRIHTDTRAAESAAAIHARAYTSGRDVVFGAGEYRPDTSEGRWLLAHELVHVGQQGALSFDKPAIQLKAAPVSIETPENLAYKLREAFRGPGTDEQEVYRILSFPVSTVRAMANYYNSHYNDHTGMGLIEDIKDEFSGDELAKALDLATKAKLEENFTYKTRLIPTNVGTDPNKFWVGLIVRGKLSEAHSAGLMDQHADMIVPNKAGKQSTVGYFGENGGAGLSGSGSGQDLGLGLKGVSADMAWFLINRRHYVDLELAKLLDVRSTLILLMVTQDQVRTISEYWEDLKKDPGTFNILGHNCSTAAAAGFQTAKITKEINGLDTPDHLFRQLKETYKDAYMISGYYGYTRSELKWKLDSGRPVLENAGKGDWKGPFIAEKILK